MSETLRPAVGVALTGNGQVIAHERVFDQFGRWHGLIRLVVENPGGAWPDVALWADMLPAGAALKLARVDDLRRGRIFIYYKLEEPNDDAK